MELQTLCFFKLTLWFRIPLYPGIYDVTGQQYTITRECWTLDKIDFVIHSTNLYTKKFFFSGTYNQSPNDWSLGKNLGKQN